MRKTFNIKNTALVLAVILLPAIQAFSFCDGGIIGADTILVWDHLYIPKCAIAESTSIETVKIIIDTNKYSQFELSFKVFPILAGLAESAYVFTSLINNLSDMGQKMIFLHNQLQDFREFKLSAASITSQSDETISIQMILCSYATQDTVVILSLNNDMSIIPLSLKGSEFYDRYNYWSFNILGIREWSCTRNSRRTGILILYDKDNRTIKKRLMIK
jgi:hypothetical protein